MLGYLRISDFALIKHLELELGPGLTVLSGETGAGKSIILAAVELLLGQRASADLIRAGAEAAVVEAQFDLEPGSDVYQRLAEEGLVSPEAGGELVVRRVVSRQGRNRVQVGGSLATTALLNEIGPELMSVCGQHAHQTLLRPEQHLLLLDAFAGLEESRREVGRAVAGLRGLEGEIDRLRQALAQRERRRIELEDVVAELEAAALDPAEEAQLKQERRLLANSETIARLAEGAHQGLYAADEGSVLEVLGKVKSLMEELSQLDETLEPLRARVESAFFDLDDAAREIGDYASRLSFDPGRLDWVEARLVAIQRITRKYGGDVPAALAALEEARAGLKGLASGEEELAALEARRAEAAAAAGGLGRELSEARREAAGRLARAVEAELQDLGMDQCRFQVDFGPPGGAAVATPAGDLGPRGLEGAEFAIAPNPGEGFKRLARIASGGELSRMLLALKKLVAAGQGSATQVFDEVDAGIGGATGSAVGAKLAALARGGQVLCITHLPQIAAFADAHFTVAKSTRDGRTATEVRALDAAASQDELARMLAGPAADASAREHAGQMLKGARELKAAL